jgi:hypothetical protein
MNYEQDVSIDESALDVEWLAQPRLMMRYGKTVARCERAVSTAKQNLDIKRAELDKKIRSNPDKYGIEKITETVISSTIIIQPAYIAVVEEQNQAIYEYNMARAAVSALQHRKDALENLVRLHGQQYFAGPSVPRDLSKEWERQQNQREANTNIKVTRKQK